MTIEQQIGHRIRTVRQGKSLTLDQLSQSTQLSKALLSKIENGKVCSPVSTLALIASVLKVRTSYFLDEDHDQTDQKCVVVREKERRRFDKGTESFGFKYYTLAHKRREKLMDPLVHVVEAGGSSPVMFHHPGEELIYVLDGRMEFRYGEERHEMSEGDCVYFDADTPHVGRNVGAGPLRLLIVICER